MDIAIKTYIFLVLLCCSPIFTTAQQVIDSDAFFSLSSTKLSDPGALSAEKIKFPWIDEVQLRTETRDFDFPKQEYTLRVSPSTPAIRTAQQALLKHYQAAPTQNPKETLELIKTWYLDWLNLYFISAEKKLLYQLEEIWEDKETIQQKLLAQQELNAKELLSLIKDKNSLKHAKYKLDLEEADLKRQYNLDTLELNFSSLINLDNILLQITDEAFQNKTDLSTPDQEEYLYESSLLAKRIALEKAENKQYFDFAQIRYRGPHEDLLGERVALGLGIQLPNSGNRKLKIAQLELEQEVLDYDLLESNQERQMKTIALQKELEQSIKIAQHYEQLRAIEEKDLKALLLTIQKNVLFDPLIALSIKESIITAQAKTLAYKQNVLLTYIKWLSITAKISAHPFKNYLKS